MSWISLIVAGCFEMGGVALMNRAQRSPGWFNYVLLAACFACSFVLLWVAMNSIPMGTAYAVWTGIGAAGGTLIGMLRYGESKSGKRVFFLVMVLGAAIGLKLVS
ncbi:DMT family transporter [Paenibacillus gansuensis]|uniref:DMT family transporter n=1 Tax=Paenibacillus gansuensis TaxID=306542 RepID=A0ABW5PE22_9BACL